MIKVTLFLTFLKIGIFNFGGGLSILALIFQEIQRHGWMTASELADLVAISQATPGPIAVNAATYVGNKMDGLLGAAVATIGVTLSSFVIMMLVMRWVDKFRDTNWLQSIFAGIRPATVGLITTALIFVVEGVYEQVTSGNLILYISLAFFAIALFLRAKLKANPIALVLVSAAVGAWIYGFVFS